MNPVPQVRKVSDRVLHLVYETQKDLGTAFIRFQEHYESPEFAGKVFTLGEFRRWYSENRGAWTYFSDWEGFNVPAKIFGPFIRGMFDPLSQHEQVLLDLVKDRGDAFYVIGTFNRGSMEVYEHEVAHALYATNEKYKEAVDGMIVPMWNSLKPLIDHVKGLGYNDSVVLDECHAYLSASTAYLDEEKVPYPAGLAQDLKELRLANSL